MTNWKLAWCATFAASLLLAGCDAPAPASGARAQGATQVAPPDAPTPPAQAPPPAAAGTEPDVLDTGVVAPTDTLASLRARHGDAQVVAAKVPGAEGEELDGWILFPDDDSRRVYVYLDDAGAPTLLRVLDPGSRWQRADGIRTGLTLAELAQRNGAPIGFMGFDWDYGGGITNWNGGHFERDPPAGATQLCPPETEATAEPGYPAGDAEFDSGNAWVVAHPPTVCGFSVNLPSPAAAGTPAQ